MLHSISLIFFDVSLLYYSVTINESKEKFKIVPAIKSIAALSSSSNFPTKVIC